ncbi:ASCH domain-containing protein [Thalassobius sp. I31.1]|uniref:ASCH domain-containing protein n=1 Tax=Thalassobius sp. I31.1 TaxID=2109912 RepID=UPI000D19CFC7|nr:ASCH domain-containing protein [Thalassobius sp. I31.1]
MTDFTNLPDRALSIRQPWAWAILNAGKRIENRPQRWKYRGPICIHASLYKNGKDYAEASNFIWEQYQMDSPYDLDVYRGGIIGTAEIVDVVTESDSPWFFGPYGYVLDNVQPLPFIPVKGALGLFRWKEKM